MNTRIIVLFSLLLLLAACRGNLPRPDADSQDNDTSAEYKRGYSTTDTTTSAPPPTSGNGAYLPGDGPGSDIPDNVYNIPDAVPRAEPLHRYANRPYAVMGKNYTPLTALGDYKERGVASWYGKKFHGQKTSIGETYDMYGMTAAHTTLPIPSYARVTNLENQKSVVVRINDRGPFMHERIIDLSYTAAAKLGIIGKGQGMVEVESLRAEDTSPAAISPIYKEPIEIIPLPAETPLASGKIYLQLGAFSSREGAEKFMGNMREKLRDNGKQLSITNKNGLSKVRIGPYSSESSARTSAQKLESQLGIKPMLSMQ